MVAVPVGELDLERVFSACAELEWWVMSRNSKGGFRC
jgi:hypothetical protein